MKSIKKGSFVKQGIACAKIMIYKPYIPDLKSTTTCDDVNQSIKEFEQSRSLVKQDIERIVKTLEANNDDKALIFNAHIEILQDIMLDEQVKQLIHDDKLSARSAIIKVFNMYIDMFDQMEDKLLKERVSDLKDVMFRWLKKIDGISDVDLSSVNEDVIVVAHDLLPSETATMNKTYIKGFITEIGGLTSHTAILARSYQIPAALGVKDALKTFKQDQFIILDSIDQDILIDVNDQLKQTYALKQQRYLEEQSSNALYRDKKAVTKDGMQVDVMVNIGSSEDESITHISYVDGIGLFRSEFLYMENTHFPTEEEQYDSYKKVLLAAGKKPVILRTLDIGGDKSLTYYQLPKEDNPFLGNRALRFCFEKKEIFFTQLKAALRASVHGNLWLMFPMVSHVEDIMLAKSYVETVKDELDKEQKPYKNVKIGIMIEVPSIALMANEVSELVDFASIGTNDLTQYLTASDRMNSSVKSYYQNYAPSVFRMIKNIADAFNAKKKPISVCGELGGELQGAAILIGLGIHKLSMNVHAIPAVKRLIIENEQKNFASLAKKVLSSHTQDEVLQYTNQFIKGERS